MWVLSSRTSRRWLQRARYFLSYFKARDVGVQIFPLVNHGTCFLINHCWSFGSSCVLCIVNWWEEVNQTFIGSLSKVIDLKSRCLEVEDIDSPEPAQM